MRIARTVATISAVLVSALWVTVSLQAQVLGVKTMTALIGPTEIPGVTIVANQPITMTAHVDPSFVHTGTVELTDDFNLHTSQAAVDSNGNATFTVYPWGNAITFKAHYDGTTIYFPSDSPSVTVNVAKASTRTDLSANPADTVGPGQSLILTAQITPLPPAVPIGSVPFSYVSEFGLGIGQVNFMSGGKIVGSAPLDNYGKATLIYKVPSNLSRSFLSFTASYTGCLSFSTSTSDPIILIVGKPGTQLQ